MPFIGANMDARNQVFQRLKPLCVALSQAALALNGPQGNVKTVSNALEDLKRVLSDTTETPDSLDETLAEYVFFPVSQVLKVSQKVSVRCLELAVQCLSILIEKGWRSRIQPQLAAQVVILCSLLAEKNPTGLAVSGTTDELRASAYWCLYHLFDVLDASSETRKALVTQSNFPQLGQTITTILDGVIDGGSVEVQISAVHALQALIDKVATQDIHAGFLPGIVSKLTKVLTPQTVQRRNHNVLVIALDTLSSLFVSTLSDAIANRPLDKTNDGTMQSDRGNPPPSTIDKNWLETAATQLKPAINSIVRLRNHSRVDVQEALARLCFIVLDECSSALSNCASIATDTLLFLSSRGTSLSIKSKLEAQAVPGSQISRFILDSIYDKVQALPTVMQSTDEAFKLQSISHIDTAYRILSVHPHDASMIDRLIMEALRDSIVITLQTPRHEYQNGALVSTLRSLELTAAHDKPLSREYGPALVQFKGQESIMSAIESCASLIGASGSPSFCADLARSMHHSDGNTQVATTWIFLESIRAGLKQADGSDEFIVNTDRSQVYKAYLEELYSFALEILNDDTDESMDPRLQAVAIRSLALRAQIEGLEFRHELIDALFPVLNFLATPNEQLQRDGITTLNIFADSCEYKSVTDLIVDNVDYLTNAVSLKLNAFNIGPQAPQVLLMMVRLAGPGLLPFLEDTIESIFTALENYHGYPLLVELLFRVLSVVAEEGAKAPQLAITDKPHGELAVVRDVKWHPTSLGNLINLLRDRASENESRGDHASIPETFPRRPWKSKEEVDPSSMNPEDETGEDPAPPSVDDMDILPPAPKTYSLLLKITELTQHFLPSASPSLRSSLLALIKTTTPAISKHENSFLPLINTLWPEIVSRLDDAEAHVISMSLDIITILCEYAGNFMRSRMVQLWPRLVEIHQQTARDIVHLHRPGAARGQSTQSVTSMAEIPSQVALKQAVQRIRSSPADYSDTSSRLIWNSLVHTIKTAVHFVDLSPELFDEALTMLEPVLETDDVLTVLEHVNPDAVWLARMRSGAVMLPEMPTSGHEWNFITVTN